MSIYEKKLAITVKLCFIETRLKKDYDLRDYFLKMTRRLLQVFEFGEACKGTFFNRTSPVVASGLFF